MRLVVLTYRLTKIKGVLVSVGICALTNATMFIATVSGAAGLALAFAGIAQASPECNASGGTGTITSTSGSSVDWTAPSVCTVSGSGTVTMTNADALTALGSNLPHDTLTNNGYLHASMTGTLISGTIAGFSNLVNVGSIENSAGATIQGDYLTSTVTESIGSVTSTITIGLMGTGSSFKIYGLNNQSGATIGSINNDGMILGTIDSGIGPNTVSQGILNGFNNDGSIGSLSNTGTITAGYGGGVSGASNNLVSVGLANSNQIGTLTNSGNISGEFGIVNGNVAGLFGAWSAMGNTGSITELDNSGGIFGDRAGILVAGSIGTLNNTITGTIESGGDGAIVATQSSTIGTINNQGTIVGIKGAQQSMELDGTITTLNNNGGVIGTDGLGGPPVAVSNTGTINEVDNSGFIGAYQSAFVNNGGSIGSLNNTGSIVSDGVAVANDIATLVSGTIDTYIPGTIQTFNNGGVISGATGVGNAGYIGSLTNNGGGTINIGTISGSTYGLVNSGMIGSLDNQTGATISSTLGTALANSGTINTITNDGSILGQTGGVFNSGQIVSLSNTGNGVIGGNSGNAVYDTGSIGTLSNDGQITSYNSYVAINIDPAGYIGTIVNSATGTISAYNNTITPWATAIVNNGQIISLTNQGTIAAYAAWGDGIRNTGSIGSIDNGGSISGPSTGIYSNGFIGSLTNSGAITGASNAIHNSGGQIQSLTNSGLISSGDVGIENDYDGSIGGSIGSLANTSNGTVVGTIIGSATGIDNNAYIGSLTNQGLITGNNRGIQNGDGGYIEALWNQSSGTISGQTGVNNYGSIASLSNDGRIIGTGSAVYNDGSAWIGSLNNTGLITGGQSGISNYGSIGTLANNGVITAGVTGVYNDGVIDSLYNNGTISGVAVLGGTVSTTYGIYTDNLITTLTNDRHGTIIGTTAISNWGSIGTLNNSGVILGSAIGVDNNGSILTIDNEGNTGVIIGNVALANQSDGSINSLVNSGAISGRTDGIQNYGLIAAMTNSGQISGASLGVYNRGLVTSLVNQGLITGSQAGIVNDDGGTITTLSNSGTIIGTGGEGATGIYNSGYIDSLGNSGVIQGDQAGIWNQDGAILTLTNSTTGTIAGTFVGLVNSGGIVSVVNAGLIVGQEAGFMNYEYVGGIANTGLITGGGFGVLNYGLIESANNGGIISSTNSGTLGNGVGLMNYGAIFDLVNTGLIQGTSGVVNIGWGIEMLDNSGTIAGTMEDGIYTNTQIGTLTNEGLITGAVHAVNIDSSGAIVTLTNSGLISAPTAINVSLGGYLGAVTNSGMIAGSIVNASMNDLSIAGGTGTVFGTLTGFSGGVGVGDIGMLVNTASNVAFTGGNLLLNDHVNVGTGTVTSSANLAIDNPINITGNYEQTTAGSLLVGVAGIGNHGELNVSSAATVDANGHVELTRLDGFRFAAGESFAVIDAATASYNIATMTVAADGFSGGYLISEVADGANEDLVVCLTNRVTQNCSGSPVAYSVATTSNAIIANNAAGGYPGSNVGLNNLANAVVAMTGSPEANRAGNQLSADPHHDGVQLATQPALDVVNVITGHADSTRLAMNDDERGISAGESGSGFATWGEAFGGGAHQSQDGQFSGYDMSSEGLVAGGDTRIGESNVRVGGVFNFTHANLNDHGDRTGDTLALDSYGLLAYGSVLGSRAYLDVIAGVMFDRFNTVRVVDFTGFNGVASGQHDGTEYVAKVAGGYRFPMGQASGTTLTPVWGVTYSHLNQDGYTESGGNGSALNVESDSNNSLKGEAGLKLEHSFTVARGDVVPEVKVLYRHEFDNSSQLQTQGFAGDETGTTFTTENAREIRNSGVLAAGVNLVGKDGVTVTLKYGAEVAQGYISQGGSLRVRWAF